MRKRKSAFKTRRYILHYPWQRGWTYIQDVSKVKKSIEEAQEENKAPSQSKVVNYVRQEQQSSHQTYYPMHYRHAQALLARPPPAYNYEPPSNAPSHAKSMEAKSTSTIQCPINTT
jgi:hypothetical protein